jgi:hypothetical protein
MIKRGSVWIVKNEPYFWYSLQRGDWVRVLRVSGSNVHVRWNPNSKTKQFTCFDRDKFFKIFKLSEASSVSNILEKYL